MNELRETIGRSAPAGARTGFSLIDLLVSMGVMGILIAVLMPAVQHVRIMAQRTECRSNIRQQGLTLQMYALDREGRLPKSVFSKEDLEFAYAPSETVHLRLDADAAAKFGATRQGDWERWDGLGRLYKNEYINSPEIFYCPSNGGLHDFPEYAARFKGGEPGPIISNYQYRLTDSRQYLSNLPSGFTIVSNATRSAPEYSHHSGNNMLKSDMSVSWFADAGSFLLASLSARGVDRTIVSERIWSYMDSNGTSLERGRRAGGSSLIDDLLADRPEGNYEDYEDDTYSP